MNYTRVNWKDYPETDTTLSAANLNVMDKGVADACESINNLDDSTETIKSSLNNLFSYNSSSSTLTINLDALS